MAARPPYRPHVGNPAGWPSGLGKGLQSPVRGFDSRTRLGRLAQWERASLTRKRSLVQTQYRPPGKPAVRAGIRESRTRLGFVSKAVGGVIEVYGVGEVINAVQKAAAAKQYRDNPVLVTMKVLEAGGLLKLTLPDDIGSDAAADLDES